MSRIFSLRLPQCRFFFVLCARIFFVWCGRGRLQAEVHPSFSPSETPTPGACLDSRPPLAGLQSNNRGHRWSRHISPSNPLVYIEKLDKVTLFNNKIASNMSLSVCLCSKMTRFAPASRARQQIQQQNTPRIHSTTCK